MKYQPLIKQVEIDEIFDVIEKKERDWKAIVIHHTVNPNIENGMYHLQGRNIDLSHYYHRGFRNGMGYHFLINVNGVIEVGKRWIYQLPGAHTKGLVDQLPNPNLILAYIPWKKSKWWRYQNYEIFEPEKTDFAKAKLSLNRNTIGISLVGNFEEEKPTKNELFTLYKLIRALSEHYGFTPEHIFYHIDFTPKSCPGSNFIGKDDLIKASFGKSVYG